MKRFLILAPAAVLAALFLLPGCSKFRDHLPPHPTDSAQLCRIVSVLIDTRGLIYGDTSAPVPVTYQYNGSNDPVKATSPAGFTFYRYDRRGRLSDVIGHPTRTAGYNGWAKYFYPAAGLIVDSFYESPSDLSDPNPPTVAGTLFFVDKMTLDTAGRVTRVERSFPPGSSFPPSVNTYAYDANGNLVWPNNNSFGLIKYDDKVNPFRTSKTWQLLYLNYSRNNAYEDYNGRTGPVSYNANGLPTHFAGPESSAPFTGYFTTIDISYSCDMPAPPKGKGY